MSVSPRPCATKRRFGLRFGPVWPLARCPDSGVLRTPFSKNHSGLAPVWSGLAHLTAGSKRFECVLSHTFTAERRPHRAPRLLPKGSSGPPEPTATSREGSPVSCHSCAAAAQGTQRSRHGTVLPAPCTAGALPGTDLAPARPSARVSACPRARPPARAHSEPPTRVDAAACVRPPSPP